ncbi:MAG: hypothetical protein ABMA64_32080 [Myxococcota bacterium]
MVGWFVAVAWGAPPAQAREAAASTAYALELAAYRGGAGALEPVCTWSRRWSEARAALNEPRAAVEHLERMKALVEPVTAAVAAGTARAVDRALIDWCVADAAVLAGVPG